MGSESERRTQRSQVLCCGPAQRHQHLGCSEPLAHRTQRRPASGQRWDQGHGRHQRRVHRRESSSQPAQPARQRHRVVRRRWPHVFQRRLQALCPLRRLDHRLHFRKCPRQPRGQKIRQKADRGPGLRAPQTRYPHPRRMHPTVAPMPAQPAPALRMQRAMLQSCGPPDLLGNVPLAGGGRRITYDHSVAGRVRAGPSAAGQPSPAISLPQICLSGKKIRDSSRAPLPSHPSQRVPTSRDQPRAITTQSERLQNPLERPRSLPRAA